MFSLAKVINCTFVIDIPFEPITTNVLCFFNQSEVKANRDFNGARYSRSAPVAAFLLIAVLISRKKRKKKPLSAVLLAKTHKEKQ